MVRNTSVSLGSHFDQFINKEIASGRFNNVSEVIRTALRLLEKEEQKLQLLRAELKKGEESGFVQNFDPDEYLERLKRKHLNPNYSRK